MGVDISVTVGVGVLIPAEDLETYAERIGNEDGNYELVEDLLHSIPERVLSYAFAGNSWTSGEHSVLIGPDRLMTVVEPYAAAPVVIADQDAFTAPETDALNRVVAEVYGSDTDAVVRAYAMPSVS